MNPFDWSFSSLRFFNSYSLRDIFFETQEYLIVAAGNAVFVFCGSLHGAVAGIVMAACCARRV